MRLVNIKTYIFSSIFIRRVTCNFDNIILIWWVVFRLNVESPSVDTVLIKSPVFDPISVQKYVFGIWCNRKGPKLTRGRLCIGSFSCPVSSSRTLSVLLQTFLKFYLESKNPIRNLCDATCYPVGIYLLKVNNRNTITMCEICSKLTMTTPELR